MTRKRTITIDLEKDFTLVSEKVEKIRQMTLAISKNILELSITLSVLSTELEELKNAEVTTTLIQTVQT